MSTAESWEAVHHLGWAAPLAEEVRLAQEGAGQGRALGRQLAPLIAEGGSSKGPPGGVVEGGWQLQTRPVVAEVPKVLGDSPRLLFLCSSPRPQGQKPGGWEASHFTAGEGPRAWEPRDGRLCRRGA